MSDKEAHSGEPAGLRRQAEAIAREKAAQAPENLETQSPEEIRRMLHELQVHQIELEMQNEELRQAQVDLDTSRGRYFDLYDLAPVGYCTVSERGLILESNLTTARLLGVPRAALVNQMISRFILKCDQDIHYRHRKQLFKTGEPQACELRIVRSDGTTFWVRQESTAAQAEDGERVGRVVMIDITELKLAEDALARSLAEQKAVYDHSPVMMCVMDTNRRVLYANPAYTDFTGLSEGALKGGCACGALGSINALDDPRGGGCGANCVNCTLWQHLEDTLKTGIGHHNFEHHRTLARDGGQRQVTLLGSTSLMHLDDRTELLLCLHDVTDHHALEAQFHQAQRMESVGRLAGGVAHDFNNLLTVINCYSALALEALRADDPLYREIEEINKAGERAASLTRQLLIFSRRQVLIPRVLNLNLIVSDMNRMLRRVLGEDLDLVEVLEPALDSVHADPGQIEQVIMNLAVNARDAMAAGGRLLIETGNVELDDAYAGQHRAVIPGRYVMLAVSDTGCGMDQETQSHIFEPFFTTKPQGEGTGLGLSTVFGIVQQSGAYIWLYSEPGKGTTFKIYFPRVATQPEAPVQRLDAKLVTGSETVLVVEDEDGVRVLIGAVLKRSGYTVLEARSGGEALLLCESHLGTIHLVITDVVMPKMSGRELANRLMARRPEIKLLFMSGYTDNAVFQHGALDPQTPFLQKPFTPAAIAGKVRETLDMESK